MTDLIRAIDDHAAALAAFMEAPRRPKIAVVGAFNRGKTALINALTGSTLLTSPLPNTEALSLITWGALDVIDSPGYGAPEGDYEALITEAIRDASLVVFIFMADMRPMPDDRALLTLIDSHDKPLIIVQTKLDSDLDPIREDWLALIDGRMLHSVSAATDAGIDALRTTLIDADWETIRRQGRSTQAAPLNAMTAELRDRAVAEIARLLALSADHAATREQIAERLTGISAALADQIRRFPGRVERAVSAEVRGLTGRLRVNREGAKLISAALDAAERELIQTITAQLAEVARSVGLADLPGYDEYRHSTSSGGAVAVAVRVQTSDDEVTALVQQAKSRAENVRARLNDSMTRYSGEVRDLIMVELADHAAALEGQRDTLIDKMTHSIYDV